MGTWIIFFAAAKCKQGNFNADPQPPDIVQIALLSLHFCGRMDLFLVCGSAYEYS